VSEAIAVRYGQTIIADNQGIADYVAETYGVTPEVIAYGGDHVVTEGIENNEWKDQTYAFGLCRIEPENNVHMVIEACVQADYPLVFVGNWDANEYGRSLRERYRGAPHVTLLDPIYDQEKLAPLRANCSLYIHGHSAGGTNPSLVEMMMFGRPILAFDCVFNRATLDGLGGYFDSVENLTALLVQGEANNSGGDIKRLALERYCWSRIRGAYGRVLGLEAASND
jgi:glycosyltransferase involved in cell wall biosynthesis